MIRWVLIACLSVLFLQGAAAEAAQNYCKDWTKSSSEMYKRLPENWWGTFALKEFDRGISGSGADWLEHAANPGDLRNWLELAQTNGWVVRRTPEQAAEGALVLLENESNHLLTVGIVREAYDRFMVVEQIDNLTAEPLKVEYDYVALTDNLNVVGYVWPLKQVDYERDPASFDARRYSRFDEHSYKGWRQSWGPAWSVMEFDKIVLQPGVDWNGGVNSWLERAAAKGWKTAREPNGAAVGALLIRVAPAGGVWVHIVREVRTNSVIVESLPPKVKKVVREELSFDELPSRYFVGYILPQKEMP